MRRIWLPVWMLQFLDIYTTSLVSVEREANPAMAAVWGAYGFLAVVVVKLLAVTGLWVSHALLVKHLPDFERPFVVGLAATTVAMAAVVGLNFMVLHGG